MQARIEGGERSRARLEQAFEAAVKTGAKIGEVLARVGQILARVAIEDGSSQLGDAILAQAKFGGERGI